mgnify:FL=1
MRNVLEKTADFVCRWMTLWVILFSALAFLNPEPFKPIGKYISYLLGVIMLGMGLTMSLKDFRLVFTRPKDVFYGVVLRYLIMPVVGFLVAKALGLPAALAAGMVLLGSCPSGTGSNVMTYIAKGDTALSVTVSSVNTVLAPLLTPTIFLLLAGAMIPIDTESLLWDIVKMVLIPVTAGVLLHMAAPKQVEKISKIVPVLSVVCIITILSSVVALNAAKMATMALILCVAVVLHNGLGLLLGYGSARSLGMPEEKSRAVSFEIGMENSGLTVALALAHLDPMAALPAAICSIWQFISGSLLAGYWAHKSEQMELPEEAETAVAK